MSGFVKIGIAFAMLGTAPLLAATSNRHPDWMTGTWVTISSGEKFSQEMCNADHNVFYDRKGGYKFMDESGRWRVDGDHLIQAMTRTGGTGNDRDLNRPRTAKIVKRSHNMLKLLWREGTETMVRCATR